MPVPVGWKKSPGHLIWDVNMYFTQKSHWFKDAHRTTDPKESKYSVVVSRYIVSISMTYSALNHIDVTAADIQNVYLQALSYEKHYVICGKEFGLEHKINIDLIRRALYCGKFSGWDFWPHLRICMTF